MTQIIEIRGLTKDYGRNRGIFDLSFSVGSGEVFGFLGPNGAGKTTAIRHLMGFIRPDRGASAIRGLDCWRDAPKIQRDLGYLPGEIAFMDEMTGARFIEFMAKVRGLYNMNRAKELMDRFELDPRGHIRKMSKGMKQKIGIILAFMHDPDVVLLDEPTSGLDPLMQRRFTDFILEEKRRGKTVLLSSHQFEEVERVCDRVGILRKGHLVAIDSIARLTETRRKAYIVRFDSAVSAQRFAQGWGEDAEHTEDAVKVSLQGETTPLIRALTDFRVLALEASSQTLEEVFMHYYGGDAHV